MFRRNSSVGKTCISAVTIIVAVAAFAPNPACAHPDRFSKSFDTPDEIRDAEYAKAASYFNKVSSSHLGDKDPRFIGAMKALAERTARLGVYRSSLVLYAGCLRLEERAYGKDSFDLVETLQDFARVCTEAGELTAAKQYYIRARTLYQQNDRDVRFSRELAEVCTKLGDYDQARSYLQSELEQAKATMYPYSPPLQDAYVALESFYLDRKDYVSAGLIYLEHAENDRLAFGRKEYIEQLLKANAAFAKHAKRLANRPQPWIEQLKSNLETVFRLTLALGVASK